MKSLDEWGQLFEVNLQQWVQKTRFTERNQYFPVLRLLFMINTDEIYNFSPSFVMQNQNN